MYVYYLYKRFDIK